MHIALITDGIYPYIMGGMQKHSFYLTKHLAQKGVIVDVYFAIHENQKVPSFKNEYSNEELEYIQMIPVFFPKSKKYPGHYIQESYIYSQRVFKEFLKHKPVDFVYIQGLAGWALLNKQGPIRMKENKALSFGINFHGIEMFQLAPSWRVKLEHLMLRPFVKHNLERAHNIFSLGGQLTYLQQKMFPGKNIIEIPIGITKDWINDTVIKETTEFRKFVFIGRYERRKGIEELNQVMQQLITENIADVEYHFIGPIPKKKQIKNNSNIFYHGAILIESQIKEILLNSDILLCPSWSEGMPTVILEAMASGCAIIATDVGAISEQVDNKNGILIKPGNTKELEMAIKKMIVLPKKELAEMKRTSIQRIKEKFLWGDVVDRTIMQINIILNKDS